MQLCNSCKHSEMLDKATFKIITKFPIAGFGTNEVIYWEDIPLTRSVTKKGRVVYHGYLKTIRLSLYDNALYIENSLSKLIYGHNMNDLTLDNFKRSIDIICIGLRCKPSDLIVSRFEFGFTINIDNKVSGIIKRLLTQWRIQGKYEIRGKKHTGVKFYHENFNYKCYDKAFVECKEGIIKPTGNWLRIEQDFKKRKHFPSNIIIALDLLNVENLNLIFKEFIGQWDKILKVPILDHNKYTQAEIWEFYARQNPIYIEDRQLYVSPNSVTKENYRFQKKLKANADYSMYMKIEDKLRSTFSDLKSNKEVINYPPILLVGNYGQIENA